MGLSRAYTLLGFGVVLFVAWAYAQGWGGSDADDVHDVPRTVRDNPGSFRSHYIWRDGYIGGK